MGSREDDEYWNDKYSYSTDDGDSWQCWDCDEDEDNCSCEEGEG